MSGERPDFAFACFAVRMARDGVFVYLDDDGRSIYGLDGDGRRVEVGEVVGRTPDGITVQMLGDIAGLAGTRAADEETGR